jgi:hypothetical protein
VRHQFAARLSDADAAHLLGVAALALAAVLGYPAASPDGLALADHQVHVGPPPEGPGW